MRQLSMATIGGAHGSPFLFSNPIQVQGGASLGGLFDWYSDAQYYNMAKAAVESFDRLNQRVSRIADKAARDKIIKDYGMNTLTENKSLNLRNQVKASIDRADVTGDPGDGFADDGKHGRKAVDFLSSYDSDISSAVQDAELKYGILQGPTAPPALPAVPAPVAPGAGALPYVLGGAGIVAVLLVTGVL
jgi:hypothetical protein